MKPVYKLSLVLVFFLVGALSTYGQILINEDFENLDVGSRMTSTGNAVWSATCSSFTVSDKKAYSGKKSLFLERKLANEQYLIELPIKESSYELSFKIWKKPQENLGISIFSRSGYDVNFDKNGELVFNYSRGEEYIPYELEKWNDVLIKFDHISNLVKVYVNGLFVGSETSAYVTSNKMGIDMYLQENSGAFVDDVVVKPIVDVSTNKDIAILNPIVPRMAVKNEIFKPILKVLNAGKDSIDGFELLFEYENQQKSVIINKTIKSGEKFLVHDSLMPEFTTVDFGLNPLKIEVKLLNGQQDEDLSDNRDMIHIHTIDPGKNKVLLEFLTSAKCGSCPITIVYHDRFKKKFGDFVECINVHIDDVMEIKDYNFLEGHCPDLIVNRNLEVGVYNPFLIYQQLKKENTLTVHPTMVHDVITGEWRVVSEVFFNKDFKEPVFHNIFIVLDSVNVNHVNYDQMNSYTIGTYPWTTIMGGFELLPSVIPGKDMYYRNVPRSMVNGVNGRKVNVDIKKGNSIALEEKINPPFNKNTLTNKHYLYHIMYDIDRKVLNFDRVRIIDVLETNSSSDDAAQVTQIHPNPCIDKITIEVDKPCTLSMVNVSGQVVYHGHLDQGMTQIDMSMYKAGVYVCTMKYADGNSKLSRIIKL